MAFTLNNVFYMKNHNIALLAIWALWGACVEPFYPNIEAQRAQRYVVVGQVRDDTAWQTVQVSATAPLTEPNYTPIDDCQVSIWDDSGNRFPLHSVGDGRYEGVVGLEYMGPGIAFRVEVLTPDNQLLRSAYDTMPAAPPMGRVHWAIETEELPGANNEKQQVVQFYYDYSGQSEHSRYARLSLHETWERHMAFPIENIYAGRITRIFPPDYSYYYCWNTNSHPDLFTISTLGFDRNEYRDFRLHSVSNRTSRLSVLYSLLVEQQSLSEQAYFFWDQMRQNSQTSGGLYGTQPLQVQGNLSNTTQPDNPVVGFFSASSVRTQRIFVPRPNEKDFTPYDPGPCTAPFPEFGWADFFPEDYPVYFNDDLGPVVIHQNYCVDCRVRGGSTQKPDYWPN